MNNARKNNGPIVILVLITIIIVVVVVKVLGVGSNGGILAPTSSVSPDILYLTQPIHTFSGTVESVNGNTIVLGAMLPPSTQNLQPRAPGLSPMPTIVQKQITYTVTVSNSAHLSRLGQSPTLAVPIFQSSQSAAVRQPPQIKPLTLSDVQVGMYITVGTDSDLRTLQGSSFTATSVLLPQEVKTIAGSIKGISGNILTVSAVPVSYGSPFLQQQPKDYTITLTSATTIVENTPQTPEKQSTQQQLTPSQLQQGMSISVTTDQDMTNTQSANAVSISVVVPPTLPTVPSGEPSRPQVVIPTVSSGTP